MYYNLASLEESEPPQLCHEAENMSSTLDGVNAAADVTVQMTADCMEDQSLQQDQLKVSYLHQCSLNTHLNKLFYV